jgi:hypothetical protein
MITRSIITRMLSYEITEQQCQDEYDFTSGTIVWVPAQESFCLKQGRKTHWATPGDIKDLIDLIDGDDLEEWFNDRYDSYPASEVLEAILEVVGTELEAAE